MDIMRIIRLVTSVILLIIMGAGLLVFGLNYNKTGIYMEMYRYYQFNFFEDIGVYNAVAAILLSYRMYDTIFEAIIMLCSIIGIMHFLPHKKKIRADKSRESNK